MYLEGQGSQRGYAMAALLVTLGIMAILMSAALPVWRHQAQREKEHELVFRGQQYIRAINLYQRRTGPGNFPPSVDALVQQRLLRKHYKDPITGEDFDLIPVGGLAPGPGQQQPGAGRGSTPGGGRSGIQSPPSIGRPPAIGTSPGPSPIAPGSTTGSRPGQFAGGGFMGVRSKSKDASIRIYNGGTHYHEWNFIAMGIQAGPGGGRGRGGPGMVPDGRGMPGPGMPGGRGRGGEGRGLGPGGGRGRGGVQMPGPGARRPGGG